MTSGFGPSYDSYIFWSREKEIGDTYTYTRIKIWWSVFFSCAEFCWHLMISINADWCGASKIPASFLLFLRAFEWRMNIWIFFFFTIFFERVFSYIFSSFWKWSESGIFPLSLYNWLRDRKRKKREKKNWKRKKADDPAWRGFWRRSTLTSFFYKYWVELISTESAQRRRDVLSKWSHETFALVNLV